MTKEEMEEIIRLANEGRPQINQTMNFNAPIGQQISHVDTIVATFDKEMGMHIANADNISYNTDSSETEILTPGIFNARIFDTNDKLVRLRDEIGARIQGAQLADESRFNAERHQIDPKTKNKWYYIWKALKESDVFPKNTKVEVKSFAGQMLEWYPEVFQDFADEEERNKFIKNLCSSISNEKSRWKEGGPEVKIEDMSASCQRRGLDLAKMQPMIFVCIELKKGILQMKAEFISNNTL